MTNLNLSVTYKIWIEEKACYKPKRPIRMTNRTKIEFGGVQISSEDKTPIIDPADKSPALILRKIVNRPNKLHIYCQRTYYRKPKCSIVGENIMCKSEFFYFSNLSDLVYIQIYKEHPDNHPDMLEITLYTLIEENGDSVLL
jgi:hypothetical protein